MVELTDEKGGVVEEPNDTTAREPVPSINHSILSGYIYRNFSRAGGGEVGVVLNTN
jgi:hypothetical protein